MKATDAFPVLKKPNLTQTPLSCFPLFSSLPAELRAHIWTLAILEDLGADLPVPPPTNTTQKPTRTPVGRGEGGRAPRPPTPPAPLLHIIPFHTLATEAPFTSAATYLKARYGAEWEASTAEDPARRQALVAEAEEAVLRHARERTVLLPPGRAPETLARFSGGWLRSAVMDSCREAQAAAHILGRPASGGGGQGMAPGHETLIGLGRWDVCCFVNARADGSQIDMEETLRFWDSTIGAYGWMGTRPTARVHSGTT